jgi:hypothetical protein
MKIKIENFIAICPSCSEPIIISKVKCGIFRHGVYKNTGKQINPHSNEERCNYLVMNNKIWGCGRPFRIIEKDGDFIAIECEYI